jgi:transcriptional regulator
MASDRVQSTLDLLILKTLSWGPAHGYAIARWIEQLTGEVLRVGEGTLYPALHRLESRGAVRSAWQVADSGRRARVYSLTPAGKQQLVTEQQAWGEFVRAMGKVLRATEQPT